MLSYLKSTTSYLVVCTVEYFKNISELTFQNREKSACFRVETLKLLSTTQGSQHAYKRNHCCRRKAIIIAYTGCVCGLIYPARNAHVPNCHPRPLWLYHIFSVLSYKRKNFRRYVINFLFMQNSARYYHKFKKVFT
jgi:hypothetical protein